MKQLYNDIIYVFSNSSQKSRIKGTLEVYHAYISDSSSNVANNHAETSDSGGWELLDQPTSTSNSPVEQPAEVLIFVQLINN